MAKKEPKTGKEFLRLAQKSDKVTQIREGKGSHIVVKFKNKTSISVPMHGNKQLAKGLQRKIPLEENAGCNQTSPFRPC